MSSNQKENKKLKGPDRPSTWWQLKGCASDAYPFNIFDRLNILIAL